VDHDEHLVCQELTNWTEGHLQTIKKSHKGTWESIISIETRHGQDNLGLESWQRSGSFLFSKTSITTLQPSQSPIQWLQGFFPSWGHTADPSSHLALSLRMSGLIPALSICFHDMEALTITFITFKRPHNESKNLKFDPHYKISKRSIEKEDLELIILKHILYGTLSHPKYKHNSFLEFSYTIYIYGKNYYT
jgi:hypothetical protein